MFGREILVSKLFFMFVTKTMRRESMKMRMLKMVKDYTRKLEIFVQFCCFGFWLFLLPGFRVFASFGPGLRVLVPPPPQSPRLNCKNQILAELLDIPEQVFIS